jgi:hypothetical protein
MLAGSCSKGAGACPRQFNQESRSIPSTFPITNPYEDTPSAATHRHIREREIETAVGPPTAIGACTALSRTAARGYLLTFTELSYVQTDGRIFWLAPHVLRLATAYIGSACLPRIARARPNRATA